MTTILGLVRTIALESTDGLARGQPVVDLGNTITVPVGKETLGRVVNVLGDPIDKRGPVGAKERRSIHAAPPDFNEQVSLICFVLTSRRSVINILGWIEHWRISFGHRY